MTKLKTLDIPALKGEALRLYQSMDWPVKRDEAWRRTPVTMLEPESFSVASAQDKAPPSPGVLHQSYGAHVRIVDGHLETLTLSQGAREKGVVMESLSKALEASPWAGESLQNRIKTIGDRFEAWHFSQLGVGLVLEIPPQTDMEEPIVVEIENTRPGTASFSHLTIKVGTLSSASVVVKYQSPDGVKGFFSTGIDYLLDDGASLKACEIQTLGDEAYQVDSSTLHMGRDTKVWHLHASFGAKVTRTQAIFSLDGPGGDLKTNGIYLGRDHQHKDIRIVQNHEAPNSQSHALYKGALRDSSRTIFQGLIEVKPAAVKTDAYLTNRNLILSDGAKADSLPQLRIDTNDVKCSHGSTTGKVNEDEVFYLMARGFSRNEARLLITEGLFAELIDQAPEFLRVSLDGMILRLLGGLT